MYALMYVYLHACMYVGVCMYVWAHMLESIHVCIYVDRHTWMMGIGRHVCIYA